MGLLDELSKILAPHSHRLNENIATQGNLIHGRLGGIQNALDDLGRPDFGDRWNRIRVVQKLLAENTVIAQVPMNEIWPVQAIVTTGESTKTPAFSLLASGIIVFAAGKEKTEYRGISGNIVFLPGDVISITPEAEGNIALTISIIRRQIPDRPKQVQTGHSGHRLIGRNTHDPQRDVIESRTGIFSEIQGEVQNAGVSPEPAPAQDGTALVDPTSV